MGRVTHSPGSSLPPPRGGSSRPALVLRGRGALLARAESRLGAAVSLSSAGALTTLAFAAASGLQVVDAPVVGFATLLLAATAGLGYRATGAVNDPIALYKADAAELLPTLPEAAADPKAARDSKAGQLGFFYASSTLTGLIVGASFIFSPISPIALFETPELPVTHMLRQDLGVFIVGLLCPIQAILTRATRAGELGEPTLKALNLLTGIACCLLVLDGKAQTDLGASTFAALEPGTAFYAVIQEKLGDPAAVGRSVTNTNAAFTVGFTVSCVYLFQAAFAAKSKD